MSDSGGSVGWLGCATGGVTGCDAAPGAGAAVAAGGCWRASAAAAAGLSVATTATRSGGTATTGWARGCG
ncbi:MAG: hypothetical protein ACKOHK_11970, partial [Planctomycetia bacterium]